MKTRDTNNKLTALLALLVFALFGLCLLLVLLTGARVYRGLVLRGEEQTAQRTARDYVITRVRQSEGLRVEDFGGCDALVAEETLEGKVYQTRVYCYEGWLMELFCAEGVEVSPAEGERLLELSGLTLSLEGDLLRVQTGPEEPELLVFLPTGQEVAP